MTPQAAHLSEALFSHETFRMKSQIEDWINFIKSKVAEEFAISEYIVDPDHTHRYKPGFWHIYSFWLKSDNSPLKIGVAGPNSYARYMSQHYNQNSANSNLAKSLVKDNVCSDNPKVWIKEHTYRINVIFDGFSKPLAHALEAHLHLLLKPKYEK